MRINLSHIIKRSLTFYKSAAFYQFCIITLLSAIITGSLLTGKSVRSSLRNNALERLGKTGMLVSSGVRYFDPSLAARLAAKTGSDCVSLLETNGYCRNFVSGKTSFAVKIFGVTPDFFKFQGLDSINIRQGEAAVNSKLAQYLGVKKGDDIILRFNKISEIPSSSPFAPDKEPEESMVLTVGSVFTPDQTGNFSLGISQIVPLNVFINLSDLENITGGKFKSNRLLSKSRKGVLPADFNKNLKSVLLPGDIGLNFRQIKKTGGYELTSDRIFLDQAITDNIVRIIPSASPVITYLANSIKAGGRSTPYSFVTGLPTSLYPPVPGGNNILINKWLSEDIDITIGDTIEMSWYITGFNKKLEERRYKFIISGIVNMEGIWGDSLLMPDFPGIAGSKSCAGWDAGIPVNLDLIRKKDEEYWNKFRGTPKAFVSYEKGRELWGNNFGPATAIRFPAGLSEYDIKSKLTGTIEPDNSGFTIRDIYSEAMDAANEGVDFSTLFLSLGFFIIISSVFLLSLVVSLFIDSRKAQIFTLRAIGFNDKKISSILFYESGTIALAGTFAGVFAGGIFNALIIKALNSVWSGAVQTNTLTTSFDLTALITGFTLSTIVIFSFLYIMTKLYLKKLNLKETGRYKGYSYIKNLWLLIFIFSASVIFLILSFLFPHNSVAFAFTGGSLMLVSMILAVRQSVLIRKRKPMHILLNNSSLSRSYFAFYPSHAVAPVLFIATGLFVLIATSVNRKDFTSQPYSSSGGTGGYLLWCETAVPINGDLNSAKVLQDNGLNTEEMKGAGFVQVRKSEGDDASCLNLNRVTTPPLLGINPSYFIAKGSFSFENVLKRHEDSNPWQLLNNYSEGNTIFGIADQTVLQWGLKLKTGDTLTVRAENGQTLNIVFLAGLRSSIFQGYVIISEENFNRFMPSISGSNIFLVNGNPELSSSYKSSLTDHLARYGIIVESTNERLAAFYQVTNTYLSVFNVLGAFGMALGVIGLGFVLMRNYNFRKREFALMLATGFSLKKIKGTILSEQIFILSAGVISGTIPAVLATMPSLGSISNIPWNFLIIMIISVIITGLTALLISVRIVNTSSLISSLRKE